MNHVLVVEDSRTQAERLRLLLTREGYGVEVAFTGEEGLRKTNAPFPTLIISDVNMPEMDGFEFCKQLKSSPETRRIPVILLTSRTSPADIINGLEAGADNFIPKPYEDGYLLGRIRRIIQQLELRSQESLDMEVALTVGGRNITVTADRQQIVELLFSTFEEMSKNYDQLAQANQQLQEARVEAERANRAKSQFVSRMSHELRTPLNAINGFAQLLEMSELAPADIENARMIHAAGRHLLDLINELLDIGRIEAEELILSPEPVRVAEIREEVVQLIQPLAAERGIAVVDNGGPPDVHVSADRQRLKQVLLNLVSNAVKYNREGGSVWLASQVDGERLRIEVTDTGKGIGEEDLPRLFVPFDRIGADETSGAEGTGLGLSVSKRLAEVMGGTLAAESELGVGSTFRLELPLAQLSDHEAVQDSPKHAADASPALDGDTSVLYIEDDPSSFRLVEKTLHQRLRVSALHATLGRQGLDLAREHAPAVILLDMNLPDIAGDEVVRLLKSDPGTRHIPVIVLSADASRGQAEHLRRTGATEYLEKPVDLHRLVEEVRQHLGNVSAGEENA